VKRVGNLSGKGQTIEQKKAVRGLMSKLKKLGKKPYNSRSGVVRVSIKGVYFEVSAMTFKWWRTSSSGMYRWRLSSGAGDFVTLAEQEVIRGKEWLLNQELENEGS
tara:strand:- start:302 stop:619 length:318 start_codon:yes stop_codon:yes gene_type:complete